jgi:hypothetical protein
MARKYPSCVVKASKRSGISKSKLQKSYNRGIGAWKNNPGSVRSRSNPKKRGVPKSQRMSANQWACARVNKLAKLKKRAGYDRDLV